MKHFHLKDMKGNYNDRGFSKKYIKKGLLNSRYRISLYNNDKEFEVDGFCILLHEFNDSWL
jgi:hypothetical protein